MSFPMYPTYSASGTEWLGSMPSHWAVKPLFAVLRERSHSNVGMVENNLLSLSYGAIIRKNINENDGLLPDSFETYQVVEPQDIVWRLTDLQNDKRSLRTAIVNERGIITSAYLATEVFGALPEYVNYLLRAYDLTKVFYSMGGGLRQSMKYSDVKWLPVLLPPVPEQSAIAAFLDREAGKIDALVEEQRRLIALLKEKRQAVISHAVTKGLDPDAPMKDSGVDGLGEVPAHWRVGRLKHLGEFNAGAGFPHEDQGVEGQALSFHKVNALAQADHEGFLLPSENTVTEETAQRLRAFVFPPGAIVFAKIGAAMLLGRFRRLRERACLDNNMMGLTVREPNCAAFVIHLMSRVKFDLIANPGTVPSLNEGQIANVDIAVPPPAEQIAIAEHLATFTQRSDELTREAELAIALLQERRSALISAAVTGKIDVRGLVAAEAVAA